MFFIFDKRCRYFVNSVSVLAELSIFLGLLN